MFVHILKSALAASAVASVSLADELDLKAAFDERLRDAYQTPSEILSNGIPSFEFVETPSVPLNSGPEKPLTLLIDRALPFPTPRSITSEGILPDRMIVRSISGGDYIEEFCRLAQSDFDPSSSITSSWAPTMGQDFNPDRIPEFGNDELQGPTVVLTFQRPHIPPDCAIYSMVHGGIQRGQSFSGNIRSNPADIGMYKVGVTGFVLLSPKSGAASYYQDKFGALNGSKVGNVLAAIVSTAISGSQPQMFLYREIVRDPGTKDCKCPEDRTLEESWELFNDPNTRWCSSNESNVSDCSCESESEGFCVGEWVHEPKIATPRSWDVGANGEPLDAMTFDADGLPVRALVERLDPQVEKQTGEYWCNVEPTFPCLTISFSWLGGEPTRDIAELMRCGLDRKSCSEARKRTTTELFKTRSEIFEGGRSLVSNDDIQHLNSQFREEIAHAGDFKVFGLPFNFVRHGFDHSDLSLIDPRSLPHTPFVEDEVSAGILSYDHFRFDGLKPHRHTPREYPFLFDIFLLVPKNQLGSPVINHFIRSYFPPPGMAGQCDDKIQECSLWLGAYRHEKSDMGTVWFPEAGLH